VCDLVDHATGIILLLNPWGPFYWFQVNGNVPKEDVFAQIDDALTKLFEDQKLTSGSLAA